MANFIRWNPTTHIYELSTNDGVSFVPLPLNASVINEGSFAKANLPATIAYEDEPNTFTQQQLIYGSNGPPSLTSSASAFLKILSDTTVHLDFGVQAGGLYPFWMQSKVNGQGSAYAMSLNPLGGRVGIGTLAPSTTLEVAGDATVTGSGGNVACKNQSNVFTAGQNLTCANPIIDLFDTAQPANGRLFRFWNSNQWLLFDALNDNGSLVSRHYFTRPGDLFLYRDYYGRDYYEKSRTTPIGHWIANPFVASNFGGAAPMTWTVTAGNMSTNRFAVVGKTLTWNLQVSGGVLGGSPSNNVVAVLPGGFIAATTGNMTCKLNVVGLGWIHGDVQWAAGSNLIQIVKMDFSNIALGAFYVYATMVLEVQ